MFRSARIKLTGWYLLIIMFVSLVFSTTLYTVLTGELKHGFRRLEMRFNPEKQELPLPLRQRFGDWGEIDFQLAEDFRLAKKRIIFNLLIINGTILGISAIAGYFLAGKTLKPIETTLEEQKRFISDASHELKTPLTALKTSIEVVLREKRLSVKEARFILKSALGDIDGLESLSNNLLSLAQYQEGNGDITFRLDDIKKVIQSAYKKIYPLAKKKGIKINLKTTSQKIEMNKENLEKMMLIFLDNSVKYTRKNGKITITTQKDTKSLIIRIKDTGIGISKENISHIFDRFYRVDQSRSKNKIPGFGLGLSLAKKIIEIHKGSVKVVSSLGKGTTFTIKLPFKHS